MDKKTKQKDAILRALKSTGSHPSADWIYTEVRKEIPNISLGTVYRNLKLLKEKGDILELDICGNVSRFDAHTEDHYHFICDNCCRIVDLDIPVDQNMNKRVAMDTGYKVVNHCLEFHGLCQECL